MGLFQEVFFMDAEGGARVDRRFHEGQRLGLNDYFTQGMRASPSNSPHIRFLWGG